MRCQKRNKQKLYYSLLVGSTPIYKLDEHGNKIVDYEKDGIVYYVETGETQLLYSEPVEFMGNIALSGSDVTRQEFGIADDRYEAVLVLNKNEIPITETSLLWYQTTPSTVLIDGVVYADESTADYRVLKVVPSLNHDRYILAKVVK